MWFCFGRSAATGNRSAAQIRLDRHTLAATSGGDAAMVRAVAAGPERLVRAQFEQFVNVNGSRLLHAAYGLCGDWQHAEDLVQQALVSVATRWSDITTDPLAYAYRCLVRANIDRWRLLRRRPEVLIAPASVAALHSGAARTSRPVVEDQFGVLEALRVLPARQRAILVLRYLQDLSESQTAEALGISVGAVKSGASRGLARLRTTMNPMIEEVDR
jgi:RNA polymerase sigma-70 factor (sigma-E family)